MRSVLSFLIALLLLFAFCSCNGNYTDVDLQKPVALPEDGVVEKELLDKIKQENAIATFTGASNGLSYEWKVFGSDLEETRDVSFLVTLEKTEGGIKVSFAHGEAFGFPALLSIRLDEKWTALAATAYRDGEAISSVSITGSDASILNLSVKDQIGSCIILPDAEKESNGVGANRPSSDGSATGQDQYQTDPVPEGKPLPVEPENQEINQGKSYTCTFSIECSTILNNLADLDPDKLGLIPRDGVILAPTAVTFYEGESVFDVLQRVCKEKGIHLEFSWTPIYNSAYIEGIHNLYEFDCGALSGWMYRVNGWYPNYGCSRYQLVDGEVVEWRYTCDLGEDVGREGSW
ncbi:MAG: DUF4430 domain-containing protein [Clostridia bacterium]|nr:DUF4430 domain-containing protein [Clostridia bacterium]